MKLTKLLMGASALSIMAAGTAHAQVTASIVDVDANAANGVDAAIDWAAEVDWADVQAGFANGIDFEVNAAPPLAIPGGTNIRLVARVVSGPAVFGRAILNSDFEPGTDTVASVGIVVDPTPINPAFTGAAGASGVEWTAQVSAGGETTFGARLPLDITGCGDVVIGLDIRGVPGNDDIAGAEGTVTVSTCDPTNNEFNLAFASDETTEDSIIENNNDFEDFGDALVGGYEDSTTTPVGFANGSVTDLYAVALDANFNPLTGADLTTSGDGNAVPSDYISSATFDVVFNDDSSLTGVSVAPAGLACVDGGANVWTCATSNAAEIDALFDGVAGSQAITLTGPVVGAPLAPIARTLITANNSGNTFDPLSDLIASEAGGSSSLDALEWAGVQCGVYDWVPDGNLAGARRNDVFRITGIPAGAGASLDAAVTIQNSNRGVSGEFHGQVAVSNGTAIMTSRSIQTDFLGGDINTTGEASDFGAADVLLHFFLDDLYDAATAATNELPYGGSLIELDCDRLVTDGNGSIGDYGDTANSGGLGDALANDSYASQNDGVDNNDLTQP